MKDLLSKANIIVSYFTILIYYSNGQCQNNNECISLMLCEQYKNTNITAEFMKNLEPLLCGFEKKDPKICCPGKKKKPIDSENDTKIQETYLPPSTYCFYDIDFPSRNITDLIEHPWTVLLRVQDLDQNITNKFHCGGSLITSRYVITTANCVKNWANRDHFTIEVRLGEWDLSKDLDCIDDDCNRPVQDILVEDIIFHENYNDFDNDIALLRLSNEAKFSDSVKPICLLQEKLPEMFIFGNDVELAGWGKTNNDNDSGSNLKLKGHVTVVNNEECRDLLETIGHKMADTQICVKGNFCAAELGSAMMIVTYGTRRSYHANLYGVESYRSSNCDNGTAVFTRVNAYYDWILKQLRP